MIRSKIEEYIFEFIFIFSILFIIGTILYFGGLVLFKLEHSWKYYFVFDIIFSFIGYIYVKFF